MRTAAEPRGSRPFVDNPWRTGAWLSCIDGPLDEFQCETDGIALSNPALWGALQVPFAAINRITYALHRTVRTFYTLAR